MNPISCTQTEFSSISPGKRIARRHRQHPKTRQDKTTTISVRLFGSRLSHPIPPRTGYRFVVCTSEFYGDASMCRLPSTLLMCNCCATASGGSQQWSKRRHAVSLSVFGFYTHHIHLECDWERRRMLQQYTHGFGLRFALWNLNRFYSIILAPLFRRGEHTRLDRAVLHCVCRIRCSKNRNLCAHTTDDIIATDSVHSNKCLFY